MSPDNKILNALSKSKKLIPQIMKNLDDKQLLSSGVWELYMNLEYSAALMGLELEEGQSDKKTIRRKDVSAVLTDCLSSIDFARNRLRTGEIAPALATIRVARDNLRRIVASLK